MATWNRDGVPQSSTNTYGQITVASSNDAILRLESNTDSASDDAIIELVTDADGTPREGRIGVDHSDNTLKLLHGATLSGGTNGICIDANGKIGIGYASPDTKLHIREDVDGYFDALRLENADNASFTARGVDLTFRPYRGYTGGRIRCHRRANWSTTSDRDSSLDFYTVSNEIESLAMRVDYNGYVGIGTDTPDAQLELTNTANDEKPQFFITNTSTSAAHDGGEIRFIREDPGVNLTTNGLSLGDLKFVGKDQDGDTITGALIRGYVDGTSAVANDIPAGLKFFTNPGGDDVNTTARLQIDKDGAVTTTGTINGASATEMGYLSGVSSAIQTQLNSKQATLTYGRSAGNALKISAAAQPNDGDLLIANGTDVSGRAIGIANDNIVEMDDADAAEDDYAQFTADGLQGRSATEVKTDLSLSNVTNHAQLPLAGGTMSGNVDFGDNDITNVDSLDADKLSIAGGTEMTAVLDEDNMATNSATALATQQSIKAYVDANAGGGGSSSTYIWTKNVAFNYGYTAGSLIWIPMSGNIYESTSNIQRTEYQVIVMPFDGYLDKVIVRTNSVGGSSPMGFHLSSTGTQMPNDTATTTVTVDLAAVNTPYTYTFGDTGATNAATFSKGQVFGLSLDPTNDINDCAVTMVFVMDSST